MKSNLTKKNQVVQSFQKDECAVLSTLQLISRKWIPYILSELLIEDKLYFTEFVERIRDRYDRSISGRVLTDALVSLEKEGIINREELRLQDKKRVFYNLTEKGEDLIIVFAALKGWGIKYGELKHKKCISNTCIHNAIPHLDVDAVKYLINN